MGLHHWNVNQIINNNSKPQSELNFHVYKCNLHLINNVASAFDDSGWVRFDAVSVSVVYVCEYLQQYSCPLLRFNSSTFLILYKMRHSVVQNSISLSHQNMPHMWQTNRNHAEHVVCMCVFMCASATAHSRPQPQSSVYEIDSNE